MQPTLILDHLSAVHGAHRSGHRCQDGTWYNPNAGARIPCPVSVRLTAAEEAVRQMHASVHGAAHDPEAVEVVASGMLAGSSLDDLDPDARDGWLHLARLGVEALAEHLDRDRALEARAAAVRARLAGAMRLIDQAEQTADAGDRL